MQRQRYGKKMRHGTKNGYGHGDTDWTRAQTRRHGEQEMTRSHTRAGVRLRLYGQTEGGYIRIKLVVVVLLAVAAGALGALFLLSKSKSKTIRELRQVDVGAGARERLTS